MKVHDLKTKKRSCGLQTCLRHAMRLGRWTGYFPVEGLDQDTAEGTRFRYKTLYIIYHVGTIFGQVLMTLFCLWWFSENEITLTTTSIVIFYMTGLISALFFLTLAQQWQALMMKAEATEQCLTLLKLDNQTVMKSRIIAYVIMALALVEHILCINFNVKFVMECLHEDSVNEKVMRNYGVFSMPYVFNYVPYNIFYAVLAELLCIQATFIWSFTDVLTICFSIYITAYFCNLNKIISTKKNNNTMSWGQLREHYSKIVVMVKEIDGHLSAFILLSFFTDLFFICLQLFNSLHRNYGSFQNCGEAETKAVLSSADYLLYFLYSFLFLVLKALCLSLFAANVHAAAQEPVVSLYDVPSSEYDQEVQRFQLQLRFTKIALTGKFFFVTRNMILQVIGTIITYELVLLQFSVNPDHVSLPGKVKENGTTTEAYGVN